MLIDELDVLIDELLELELLELDWLELLCELSELDELFDWLELLD